jgi:hypothetical protein
MIDSIHGINGIFTIGGWHTKPTFSNTSIDSTNTQRHNGDVRVNGITGKLEYHANGIWSPLNNGPVTIELTTEVRDILDWCKNKIKHEQMIAELSDKYPSVRSAVEQLDTLVELLKDKQGK